LHTPSRPAYTIWLVRHAEVVLPAGLQGQSCCYGATDLPAQHAATLAAAQALSPQLQSLWAGRAPRWVSGLQRAQQLVRALETLMDTAMAHAASTPACPGTPAMPATPATPWHTDCRLNEFHFGTWELKPWADIPKAAFDDWTANFPHHAFGGAETVQQMVHRVRAALHQTVQQLKACGQREALWVAHAGTARALQVLQANPAGEVAQAADWPRDAPAPGALCAYVFPAEAFIH
jgi:alpha-ribazole phosphatase